MEETIFQQRTDLTKLNEAVNAIRDTVGKVIVGQHQMVDLMIAGLLSDGHILIEGVLSGQYNEWWFHLISLSIDGYLSLFHHFE